MFTSRLNAMWEILMSVCINRKLCDLSTSEVYCKVFKVFLCIFHGVVEFYGFPVQVGRYLPEVEKMFDFSKEKVVAGFEESLQRLGLDYVDVLQVSELLFVF